MGTTIFFGDHMNSLNSEYPPYSPSIMPSIIPLSENLDYSADRDYYKGPFSSLQTQREVSEAYDLGIKGVWCLHMGGCQNYGPFLAPCFNTAPNIYGTEKGTIILTTTHMV